MNKLLISLIILLFCSAEMIFADQIANQTKVELKQMFDQTYSNQTFLSLAEIPRNITDIYKGIWNFQKTGKMNLKKINGRVVFKILNEKSIQEEIGKKKKKRKKSLFFFF